MHIFTFTDFSLIPVADMPIFTDILQFYRSGEKEQKSSEVYVCVCITLIAIVIAII